MFKKLAATLCALCMFVSAGTTALAATEADVVSPDVGVVEPRYAYADYVDATLSISGGTAYVDGEAQGKSNVTKVKITAVLQKKSGSSWSTVKSWSDTASDTYAYISETRSSLTSSATYRVKVTAVFNGSETVTVYSDTEVA